MRCLGGLAGLGHPKAEGLSMAREHSAQGLTGPEEAAHDRPDWDLEGLGDVAVGQLHQVREGHHRPELGAQGGEGLGHGA